MGIKDVHQQYQLAAARGHIKQEVVNAATLATILESGITAFQKGYMGHAEWDKIKSDLEANGKAEDIAGTLQESLLTDVTAIRRPLRESMTTSDLAAVLGTIRSRILRKTFNPVESDIFALAQKRPAADFRLMQGYRVDPFNRLALRPEATDVTYANWGVTADGYRVSNFELAISYTWEMWTNDDLGVFMIAMENLGVAARRNRALICFEAIAAQLPRTQVAGAAGGPDVAHVQGVIDYLTNQVSPQGGVLPFDLTDIAIPTTWRTLAATTLNSENLLALSSSASKQGTANPVYKAADLHREPMMKEILGQDWLAWDNRYPWLEFSTLAGFETGPRTYAKLPNVQEYIDQGSFENHSLAVKVGDVCGAFVTQAQAVVRVMGS
jgi:hypothetical protein